MNLMPHEMTWGDVYFPPLLLVVALAYGLMILTSHFASRLGLLKYVAHPAVAEICLVIIYVGVLGQFITIF